MVTVDDLLDDFTALARGFHVVDCGADLGPLMRFEPNLAEPIHRWYNYKEGFSKKLVTHLLSNHIKLRKSAVSFLDPFCGVGTSLLAAEETFRRSGVATIRLRGVEINPYVQFAARTKLSWDTYDPRFLMRAAAASTNGLRLPEPPALPALSTLRNPKFIPPIHLRQLLELRDKARLVAKGRKELSPLMLGLASAAERVFHLRKDGRALRYTPREASVSVAEEVSRAWHMIAEDLQLGLKRNRADCRVLTGDGRRAHRMFNEKFDVVLFSPPYLNNIDYTEVYKIELWLLGFVTSGKQMLAQRKRTFRSHPSCSFPAAADASVDEVKHILGRPFNRLLEYSGATEGWRPRLIAEYFADMLCTLRNCRRLVRASGRVFLVVGNSVHGSPARPIPIATDLWTCRLANAAGLRVEALMVARRLARRSPATSLSRESVIVLSKR